MISREIEAWVLRTLKALESSRFEDSHVELKLKWPDPKKSARQVAAHANAAYPDPFMWIIGVDEKTKSYADSGSVEMHTWIPQLKTMFENGFAPNLVKNLVVPYGNVNLTALVFESDRAPYLAFNDRGESTFYWRRGTAAEIANRSEIVSLFTARPKTPLCEVRKATVDAGNVPGAHGEPDVWALHLTVYVRLLDQTHLHIPKPTFKAWLEVPESRDVYVTFDDFDIWRPEHHVIVDSPSQLTIKATGEFTLRATANRSFNSTSPHNLIVHAEFPVVEFQDRPLTVQTMLRVNPNTRTGTRDVVSRKFNGKISYDNV